MPLQQRMTDYHCHILPGVDDGPAEEEVSIEMARLLHQAGYQAVYCTPHLIRGMYEAPQAQVVQARNRLQDILDRETINIRLLMGREYYLDEFLVDMIREPQLLEGTDIMMIEIPSHVSPDLVKETLYTVCRKGFTPMIAHPERCALLETETFASSGSTLRRLWPFHQRYKEHEQDVKNTLLDYLKQLGCRFQANLGSLKGQYGTHIKSNARYFESTNVYTHAGTDAHSPDGVREILGIH
jgi:protein-tyrosine phosphatase